MIPERYLSDKERYNLPSSFYQLPLVKKISEDIANGFSSAIIINLDNKPYHVYTSIMAIFLLSEKVKVNNYMNEKSIIPDKNSETEIDGREFQQSYVDGYNAGIEFFNQNYKIDTATLYGSGLTEYISTLKYQCFEAKNDMGWGWNSIKRTFLATITKHSICLHGYYSGIYSQIEILMKLHKPIADALITLPVITPGAENIDIARARLSKNKSDLSKQLSKTKLLIGYLGLFNNATEARQCLMYMKKVGLVNIEGKPAIGDREKYRLMAFVEALQHKNLLCSTISTANITSIIAAQIVLDYQRPRNEHHKKYDQLRDQYLSSLNEISTGNLTWSIIADNG